MHSKLSLAVILGGLSALQASCSPGPEPEDVVPEVDCDQVDVPTYAEVTMWPDCVNCHASTLTGANRQGAPEGIDYDTYESASALAYLAAVEVASGTMPFTGTVTEEQKQSLYAWALCDTPE